MWASIFLKLGSEWKFRLRNSYCVLDVNLLILYVQPKSGTSEAPLLPPSLSVNAFRQNRHEAWESVYLIVQDQSFTKYHIMDRVVS